MDAIDNVAAASILNLRPDSSALDTSLDDSECEEDVEVDWDSELNPPVGNGQ